MSMSLTNLPARRALFSAASAIVATAIAGSAFGLGSGSAAAVASNPARPSMVAAPAPSHPVRAEHRTVHVPRVVGMTESKAQCALVAAGLRWRFRGDSTVRSTPVASCGSIVTPDPKVISQSLKAGTHVHRRSIVVLDDTCLRQVRKGGSPCF